MLLIDMLKEGIKENIRMVRDKRFWKLLKKMFKEDMRRWFGGMGMGV